MATTGKLSFRARTLDANKPMPVYFGNELPDLSEATSINRAVPQMPTGMEKEEEMESHLQDAILAQQASTSGIAVENHVIPTPKVYPVDPAQYDLIYPPQKNLCGSQYIKVQAWLSMDQEEPEYDMDSEDEEWLKGKPHIDPTTLEMIFEMLESRSSESQICLPDTARSILTNYDESIVDDVYDYWLTKRKAVTKTRGIGCGGLIPRVRTEAKKDGGVNPYVAFRRRAEKMQTRKNRKNDEDSYEKILRIGNDLRRTVSLVYMVKKREIVKLSQLENEMEILKKQMELQDFDMSLYNQIVQSSTKDDHATGLLKEENGVPKRKSQKKKNKVQNISSIDREVPNKAWLKKNAEVWNMAPSMSGVFSGVSPIVEMEKTVSTADMGDADGAYTFKRRKHCSYRAARIPLASEASANTSHTPIEQRFFLTSLPLADSADSAQIRNCAFTRRRLGRGGRVIFDRVVPPCGRVPFSDSASTFDPFLQDVVLDDNVSFTARLAPVPEEEDALCSSWTQSRSRFVTSVLRYDDSDLETKWLSSVHNPFPLASQSTDDRPPPKYNNFPGNHTSSENGEEPDEPMETDNSPSTHGERRPFDPLQAPQVRPLTIEQSPFHPATDELVLLKKSQREQFHEQLNIISNGTDPNSGNAKGGGVGLNKAAATLHQPATFTTTASNNNSKESIRLQQMSTWQYGLSVVGVPSAVAHGQLPSQARASSGLWDGGHLIREPSRSPSESNSSSVEWPPYSPPSRDPSSRIAAYALASSEEESAARTGDHPKRQSHPATSQHVPQHHVKSSSLADGTPVLLSSSRPLLAPAPSVG